MMEFEQKVESVQLGLDVDEVCQDKTGKGIGTATHRVKDLYVKKTGHESLHGHSLKYIQVYRL